MTLLRRILREPVFSGHPVLSGHLEESRGCPLNTGVTVLTKTYRGWGGWIPPPPPQRLINDVPRLTEAVQILSETFPREILLHEIYAAMTTKV